MQKEILEQVYTFIRGYSAEHGFPPSIREIAEGCHISIAYAVRCLDFLEAKGRLTREPGKARSIRLVEENGTTK